MNRVEDFDVESYLDQAYDKKEPATRDVSVLPDSRDVEMKAKSPDRAERSRSRSRGRRSRHWSRSHKRGGNGSRSRSRGRHSARRSRRSRSPRHHRSSRRSRRRRSRSRSSSRSHSRSRSRSRSYSSDRGRSRRTRRHSRSRRDRDSRRRHNHRDGEEGGGRTARHGHRHRRRSREAPQDKSGSGPSDSEGLTPEEKEQRRLKRQQEEMTRDARTVFISQLVLRAKEKHIKKFLEESVGPVRSVVLMRDKITGKSKGFSYVEFKELESVPKALMMNGTLFMGFPLQIKPSESEKNYAAQLEKDTSGQSTIAAALLSSVSARSTVDRRIYVGNLHPNVTEDVVRPVFEAFGEVVSVTIPLEGPVNRGYAFVEYRNAEDASKAMQGMNNQELAGRALKVSTVNDTPAAALGPETANWKLDNDEGGGMGMSHLSRVSLMNKLASGAAMPAVSSNPPANANGLNGSSSSNSSSQAAQAGAAAAAALAGGAGPSVYGGPANGLPATAAPAIPAHTSGPIGEPSKCMVLHHMFNPDEEDEPGWEKEVEEEVEAECKKFGSVLHIYLDPASTGDIYVMFQSSPSAETAARALNGRFFAGRTVRTEYIPRSEYMKKFPDATTSEE